MASIIKLKRSLSTGTVPSQLQEGELAVNLFDKKLFVGGQNGGANVVTVSGDQYNLATASSGNTATVTLTVDNDAFSNDSVSFVGGSGISLSETGGVITFATSGAGGGGVANLTFQGTSNEIAVSQVGNTVTHSLPSDVTIANDLTVTRNLGAVDATLTGNLSAVDATLTGDAIVSGNMHIDGDLTVEGETTYISSSTVNVDDSMLKLSANNIADTVDHGVYAQYISGGTTKYSGYFRDTSDTSVFKFYKDLEVEPTSTVNVSGAGYTLAQVDAIIDGGTY